MAKKQIMCEDKPKKPSFEISFDRGKNGRQVVGICLGLLNQNSRLFSVHF